MSDVADQRFAPPRAHVEDLATGDMVLAGRGTRFLAALVDGILGAAVGWAMFSLPFLRPLLKDAADRTDAHLWSLAPTSLLVGAVAFLLLQGWPLLKRGQTLGKMMFKLRIVRPDGTPPDAWRLLGLRYGIGMLANVVPAVAMIYGLIDSLLIFRRSRRCLHDTIADTVVVKL